VSDSSARRSINDEHRLRDGRAVLGSELAIALYEACVRTSMEALAEAVLANLRADTSGYLQHRPGAAERAAAQIAELL
jgi:hypothetical protein